MKSKEFLKIIKVDFIMLRYSMTQKFLHLFKRVKNYNIFSTKKLKKLNFFIEQVKINSNYLIIKVAF
jgi:hypothetical protein